MNARIIVSLLALSCVGTIGNATANDAGALPNAKMQNGISYLSGGVGRDQVRAMKSAAGKYTLMLTCAQSPSGQYLADVDITIQGKSGMPALETVTQGPILLAKLSPGEYKVKAVSGGHTVRKTIHVEARHVARVNLYWPDNEPMTSGRRDANEHGM